MHCFQFLFGNIHTDSGRGTSNSSRPSSQVDVSDPQRVSRNENLGKKAVQAVLPEQVKRDKKNVSSKKGLHVTLKYGLLTWNKHLYCW